MVVVIGQYNRGTSSYFSRIKKRVVVGGDEFTQMHEGKESSEHLSDEELVVMILRGRVVLNNEL